MNMAANIVGQTLRPVDRGASGYAIFGPYESRPAGVYRVHFELARDGDCDGDDVCAVLDVGADDGATIIAERRVLASELRSEPQRFSLLFELDRIRDRLEYRIRSTGAAALRVGETPELVRVAAIRDEQPLGILADLAPAQLQAETRAILRSLTPHRLTGPGFVRLGNVHDGGYVCIDDFDGIDTAFSFGINDDISWDIAAADRGLRIYQFDHTVADPAPDDDRMIFKAEMIAPESGPGRQDLAGLIRIHDRGRERPNIILKMDIEGGEWPLLAATSSDDLARIAWIACELHYFQGLAEPEYRERIARGLRRLGEQFALVHVHSNVWGGFTSLANIVFPNVIEATFVNRGLYELDDEVQLFPTSLDATCDPRLPDFYLGAFRF